jgi:hypothetical protein
MKKNLSITVVLISGLLLSLSSCVKDTFTEKDAFTEQQKLEILRDSLKNVGGIIDYSVAAVLASDASWFTNYYDKKGSQQLNQVIVTISQYGKIAVDTTDVTGIASFKDLRIGTVNVNVRKTGYTEIDFVALLPALPDTVYAAAYNVVRHAGTLVPVFSLTDNLATISGIVTVETDLTNTTPEPAANVQILATIDVDDNNFDRYIYNPSGDFGYNDGTKWWKFNYYGVIKEYAIHGTISKATTASDGSFSLKVPSTVDGLPITLFASEFASNQTLLQPSINNVPVWGVQTVRTLFGPSEDFTYSSVPELGYNPDMVQSAYVQFSAPTGIPAAQPTTVATAIAYISASGIVDSISVINPGEGYSVVPRVEIFNITNAGDANGFGKGATATATITNGKVTAITVTNAGTGYSVAPIVNITIPTASVKAVAQCIVTETGQITGVDFPWWAPYTMGFGYTAPPTVTFFPSVSGKGAGATGVAIVVDGQVVDVVMTNQGSGYTGKNTPSSTRYFKITTSTYYYNNILARASKTYIRDIYFGTGMRMTDEDYSWYYNK